MLRKLALVALVTMGASAQAQSVLTEKNISLDLANELATTTVNICQQKGYNVSAAVVDRAGVLRSFSRANNAGPHTVQASIDKAFTSVSGRNLSGAMMQASQSNAGAANLGDINGFLLLAGGVPVKIGDEVIGAIGVGGAPGGHLDEECAVAALDSVKAKLK